MTPERLAELDAAAPIIDAATDLECLIMEICGDVAELPDRTSPEDQPDMMMVNFEELRIILDTRLTPCVSAYPDLKAHIAALEAEVARLTSLMLDEDGISDAIEESFDVEWSSRDGARHVVGWFEVELGRAALAKASA